MCLGTDGQGPLGAASSPEQEVDMVLPDGCSILPSVLSTSPGGPPYSTGRAGHTSVLFRGAKKVQRA